MKIESSLGPHYAESPSSGTRTLKALVDGSWYGSLADTPELRRKLARVDGFRHRVSADASAEFPAASNRYHLYVSYACPWAHRTILYRRLKGLENVVSLSVLHPHWAGPHGWTFGDGPLSTIDHAGGRDYLYQVYLEARHFYTGGVSVPVLWDKKRRTIVNNESSEIIRMLNSEFDAWGDASVDFYPVALRNEIDALNAWIVRDVCEGVYRAGFADSQQRYERAVVTLFDGLDQLEQRLSRQPFLLGERITECDWHLFTTLCRFDTVYYGALKCNLRRLLDYPALSAYTRRIYELPGVAETVRFDHMKWHYFDAIGEIDPTILPLGPALDFTSPPDPAVDSGFEPAPAAAAWVVEDLLLAEVHEFHAELEALLKPCRAGDGGDLARIERALADDFVVIHPDGTRQGKQDVLRNFAAARGTKPAHYALEISEASVRIIDRHSGLVTYRESHRGEPGRSRISSALLRRHPASGAVEWQFLQETPLAAAPPRPTPQRAA